MSNSKWLGRALMGGVALSVMASGAQADELSELKAQLEALQARVSTIESSPSAVMPEGASLMTFARGAGSNADWGPYAARDAANYVADRGFTIAITPTADMPAPVAEVTVYGYVKGDVRYDFDFDMGSTFFLTSVNDNANRGDHITLHAQQTRFGIRSKVDTAVGQIRTLVELDFFGSGAGGNSPNARMRHAWGEWDMTPNWTLGVGQYWQTAGLVNFGISTVDFSGPAGPTLGRRAQVRLTYTDGPLSWAVAIEKPTHHTDTAMPNISAYLQYDVPGGHQFYLGASVADWEPVGRDKLGWVVQGGANVNLADVASLTLAAAYGEGEVISYLNQQSFSAIDRFGNPTEAWGVGVGLSFAINEATSFNVGWGMVESLESNNSRFITFGEPDERRNMTVHANILWQPVRQLRLGWEVMWGQKEYYERWRSDRDALSAQFGAWFFF